MKIFTGATGIFSRETPPRSFRTPTLHSGLVNCRILEANKLYVGDDTEAGVKLTIVALERFLERAPVPKRYHSPSKPSAVTLKDLFCLPQVYATSSMAAVVLFLSTCTSFVPWVGAGVAIGVISLATSVRLGYLQRRTLRNQEVLRLLERPLARAKLQEESNTLTESHQGVRQRSVSVTEKIGRTAIYVQPRGSPYYDCTAAKAYLTASIDTQADAQVDINFEDDNSVAPGPYKQSSLIVDYHTTGVKPPICAEDVLTRIRAGLKALRQTEDLMQARLAIKEAVLFPDFIFEGEDIERYRPIGQEPAVMSAGGTVSWGEYLLCYNAGSTRTILAKDNRFTRLSVDHSLFDEAENKRHAANVGLLREAGLSRGLLYNVPQRAQPHPRLQVSAIPLARANGGYAITVNRYVSEVISDEIIGQYVAEHAKAWGLESAARTLGQVAMSRRQELGLERKLEACVVIQRVSALVSPRNINTDPEVLKDMSFGNLPPPAGAPCFEVKGAKSLKEFLER